MEMCIVDICNVNLPMSPRICHHPFKSVYQQVQESASTCWVLDFVLICQVKQTHHQVLDDGGISEMLFGQSIVEVGREVIHQGLNPNWSIG